MIYGSANTWNAPMMAITMLNRITGEISGMVTFQVLSHHVAPSMSAAS